MAYRNLEQDSSATGSEAVEGGGLAATLERICEQALAVVGYDLIDLEYRRERRGWVLRVFIDHAYDGCPEAQRDPRQPVARITHDDCASASRHLSTVLDVEDPIDVAYHLEVSSPGVQRPLRKARDFERFVGFSVRVTLHRPRDGRRNFTGEIVAASAQRVELDLGEQRVAIAPSEIKKARLTEEF